MNDELGLIHFFIDHPAYPQSDDFCFDCAKAEKEKTGAQFSPSGMAESDYPASCEMCGVALVTTLLTEPMRGVTLTTQSEWDNAVRVLFPEAQPATEVEA